MIVVDKNVMVGAIEMHVDPKVLRSLYGDSLRRAQAFPIDTQYQVGEVVKIKSTSNSKYANQFGRIVNLNSSAGFLYKIAVLSHSQTTKYTNISEENLEATNDVGSLNPGDRDSLFTSLLRIYQSDKHTSKMATKRKFETASSRIVVHAPLLPQTDDGNPQLIA